MVYIPKLINVSDILLKMAVEQNFLLSWWHNIYRRQSTVDLEPCQLMQKRA